MSLLCISSFFSPSVLLRLLKHVKLIIFENYNECKTKHFFLIKKVVTWFDKKKKNNMAEKEHWWREESITEYTKEEDYFWGLKEDLIAEDPKENPFNEKPKDNAINGDPQEL